MPLSMRPSLDQLVLRGMYLTYLGAAGIAITYWPYHFEALGLTKTEIGLVFGVRMAMGVITQPLLSGIADRWGRPVLMLFLSALTTVLLCAGMLIADEFLPIALVMWLSAPFVAVFVPLTDATTVRRIGIERYGGIRLWGSVGFGATVAIFGFFVRDMTHAESGLVAIPTFLALAASCALLCGVLVPSETRTVRTRASGKFRPGAGFAVFALANGLHWSCVTIYNVYFPLHTEALGMTPFVPGVCVAVGITGEITAFAVSRRLLRGSPVGWAVAMCTVSALRWLVVATASSVPVMVIVQAAHFFSFGVWFSLAMRQLGRYASLERRATLQGLFSAVCFGVGGAFGSFGGGALMEHHGGDALFYACAIVEVIALVVFVFALRGSGPIELDSGGGIRSR